MTPKRRSDDLVVREVGGEFIAYALDTEQVTAIDKSAAIVWPLLDGSTTLDQIVASTDLDLAEVQQALVQLHDAGLLASGVDRRRLLGLAAAGVVGAGALITIGAPMAMAAGSSRTLQVLSACVLHNQGARARLQGTVSGTGYPPSISTVIRIRINFDPSSSVTDKQITRNFTYDVDGSGNIMQPAVWQFPANAEYRGVSYTVTATSLNGPSSSAQVTNTTSGTCPVP